MKDRNIGHRQYTRYVLLVSVLIAGETEPSSDNIQQTRTFSSLSLTIKVFKHLAHVDNSIQQAQQLKLKGLVKKDQKGKKKVCLACNNNCNVMLLSK